MTSTAMRLVHEGWRHLQLERPLAAWASWQRALRAEPGHPAALEAIDALASSRELPTAARTAYRFEPPLEQARDRWNEVLGGVGLEELDAARAAFAAISDADPFDAQALYNEALCLAWLGRNTEAIAALDGVVTLLAIPDADRAESAWTLAEVLRLGAGAETKADDLSFTWTIARPAKALLERWPNLVPRAAPRIPPHSSNPLEDVQVYDWLDRPSPGPGFVPMRASDLPRALAVVIVTATELRVSTPDPSAFELLDEPAFSAVASVLGRARKHARPLALALADAAVGMTRAPRDLAEETRRDLERGAVEMYYESRYLHVLRRGLDDRNPLEAARAAQSGDAVARVKLSAVVRFREQLAARPGHELIYHGYPVDRLRRRLGLLAHDPSTVDSDDPSCMSELELDGLEPSALDDERLADAVESAAGFRDDHRTARFAAELARRNPLAFARFDPTVVIGPLVRDALASGSQERALEHLKHARATVAEPHRRTMSIWMAELLAATGSADTSRDIYLSILGPPGPDAAVALDGARTLLDNGHVEQALVLLREARSRAVLPEEQVVKEQAEALLELHMETNQ